MSQDWLYRYHAVAFLDLLGQKAAFDNIHGVPATIEGGKKLTQTLRNTITPVRKLREFCKENFEQQSQEREVSENVPETQRELF